VVSALFDVMVKRGLILFVGGVLEEPPKEGEPLKLKGSAFMAYAASKEEVLDQLKNDIYTTSGVWDLSKVCSQWFRVAFL
jgi:hypothetical protein